MSDTHNPRRWPLVLIGLAAIGLFLYASIEIKPQQGDARPLGDASAIAALGDRSDLNLLFVLVDTLRSDRMSTYGYERQTTPFLDELARTGIRFDRHLAQSSWTKSSMASMWSGLYPLKIGITRFQHQLSQEVRMPAEILAEAGIRTVGMYRNGWVNAYFGFDQGFDRYYRPMGQQLPPEIQRLRPNEQSFGSDEDVVADAIEFLRLHGHSQRWFVYLHLMDLHEYTYDEETALFGNTTSDIYDNSLLRTDWMLSYLYDYMEGKGLLDKTIVVVLSDHGEAFGERGFEGHARAVFPETTETPLIVSLPFRLEPGVVVETPTSNLDIWPTLLDLLGLPDQGDVDGRSRLPAILAAASGLAADDGGTSLAADPDEPEQLFAFLDENWGRPDPERKAAVTVTDGEYRYVAGTDITGMPFEVLLSIEEGQIRNEIEEHPEVAGRMRTAVEEHLEMQATFVTEDLELDEMQLDQLRALGYELP